MAVPISPIMNCQPNERLLALLRQGGAAPVEEFIPGRAFVIYGAGNRGREAKKLLEGRGCVVRGFIDRNAAEGSAIEGVPCVRPESPLVLEWAASAGSLIAIFNHEVAFVPIAEHLRNAGYEPVLSFYDLHTVFQTEIDDFFWLTKRSFYTPYEAEVRRAYALWADETSRQVYEAALALRLEGDYATLEALHNAETYFPGDVPSPVGPLRIVDCGAFDGDTLLDAMQRRGLEFVAAFEPDGANFGKLRSRFQQGELKAETAVLFPCGVWSETTQLHFHSGQGVGSHIGDEGDITISCVALDDVLHGVSPTLIKMDIEGAEAAALRGAYSTIQRHRPYLALSAYHRPEDLWALVELLANWELNYEFYLRSHCLNGFELVLYAVPQ
jgi:FkbM family methyltransferase